MPNLSRHPLAALCLLLLSACTVVRETTPSRTASEQLLVAHATEIAADRLAAVLPAGQRAFVDTTYVRGDGADYAISAIRAACLRRGLLLATDKASSDLVVEVRMGAASFDAVDTVLGLPAMSVYVPGAFTTVPIPELSFFSRHQRRGATELSAFAYDTRTGRALAFVGPVSGQRDLDQVKILSIFGAGGLQENVGDKAKP
jgi:hypothetical protein